MFADQNGAPYFVSLGMFIIDEIHFPALHLDGILGGGGTFAICGSRMIMGNEGSKKCAWFVDIGNDCPSEILDELKSWNTGGIFRYDNNRRCTRGWNGYGPNEFREFKYLTAKKRITVADLRDYPYMLKSKSFHLVCSPARCTQILEELSKSSEKVELNENPVVIWEPIPDCCTPENLQETLNILSKVDILTPNAAECAAFFNKPEPTGKQECEEIAKKFIKYMTKPQSGVVLRCGSIGSLLVKSAKEKPVWFPAYHTKLCDGSDNPKVIDPTGCGNTFVGAFATEFVKSNKNFERSCMLATVASGACIEQHGLPKLTLKADGVDLWNGESVQDRLNTYLLAIEKIE